MCGFCFVLSTCSSGLLTAVDLLRVGTWRQSRNTHGAGTQSSATPHPEQEHTRSRNTIQSNTSSRAGTHTEQEHNPAQNLIQSRNTHGAGT